MKPLGWRQGENTIVMEPLVTLEETLWSGALPERVQNGALFCFLKCQLLLKQERRLRILTELPQKTGPQLFTGFKNKVGGISSHRISQLKTDSLVLSV